MSWRRPGRQNGAISWENDALEGRNKGRRTEEMGRDGRKQESLTTGKLFSPYYIYSGKPHAKKHISHASQATGPPHSNRLKSGVKNEVNFVAL